MRNTPLLGRSQHTMPEPPTFIHDLTPQRGPRFVRAEGSYPPPPPPEPPKPRLKKLRLFLVLSGLTILALISTVFGMLMAVASDLPSLDNRAELRAAENSLLFADGPGCKKLDEAIHNPSCRLAKLTGNLNRILVGEGDVSPYLKNAVIAVEDRRFYEHEGVDYTGIARALWQDLRRRQAVQGGSTITQQAARVRSRLSPRAQVAQGQDPHPVPQHRLLRQRRLWGRVGHADLFR
jgi:membrane peptidoglycan carboxypeptidase